MQSLVCVDDFGLAVYACRYTGALVWADCAVVIGATMPGVRARYVIAPTDEAAALHKASGIAFHESEANCNTCRFLERVKRDKRRDGLLFGRCTRQTAHDDVMAFHPDDHMNMTCYESRWAAP